MPINDFMKLDQLATFTNTVLVTFVLIQVLKDLKPFKQLPTKYLSIIIGVLNVIMISVMQGTFDFKQLYLMIINGVFVGLTAMASHDFPKNTKKENKEIQTINNFYETPITESLDVATDTNEFDNIIDNNLIKEDEIKG